MGVLFVHQFGLSYGIAGGVLAGLLFGSAMGIFVEMMRKKMQIKDSRFMGSFLELQKEKMKIKDLSFEGEDIVFQGPANHFLKFEGRGGWLLLTNRRLIFRSHGVNIQNQPLEIPIAAVRSAVASRTLGIIPNGLQVELLDGHHERFVVNQRNTWEQKISSLVQSAA
jgi:hypothetical protein